MTFRSSFCDCRIARFWVNDVLFSKILMWVFNSHGDCCSDRVQGTVFWSLYPISFSLVSHFRNPFVPWTSEGLKHMATTNPGNDVELSRWSICITNGIEYLPFMFYGTVFLFELKQGGKNCMFIAFESWHSFKHVLPYLFPPWANASHLAMPIRNQREVGQTSF